MHRSGIAVEDELRQAFSATTLDPKLARLVVKVDGERFVHEGPFPGTGRGAESDFAEAAAALEPNQAAYVLVKDGEAGQAPWVMVSYVPDGALVKHKMLYASSRASLKEGLGGAQFGPDYFCSAASELTLAQYRKSTEAGDRHEIMSHQERAKRDAHVESMIEAGAQGGGPRSGSGMAGVPINVDDSAKQALAAYKEGGADCVLFSVDAEKELLHGERVAADAYLRRLEGEPRYLLVRVRHEHNGRERADDLFVYYCPDSAKPRAKMMSATFRAMVVRVVQEAGVAVNKSMEASVTADVEPAELRKYVAPEPAGGAAGGAGGADGSGPARYVKPKPGAGARRLHGGAKFQADA